VAETSASEIRRPEISHQLTPTFDATVDSMNKLCEKDIITANIKTSFTVNSNDTIAAIPAYKFKAFPNTSGTAASPDSPRRPISGLILSITQGSTGVYCKMVTISVMGKMTFPNVHVT